MRILFDHGTPIGIARRLSGHAVTEARELGWDRISNGELLAVAERAGFDVLLTTDKNIRHQQNLTGRKISLVVLGNSQWPVVRLHLDRVSSAVNGLSPGSYVEVEIPLE
jgi:predicted nuclease of predicted toxin-antitoxin system